MAVHVADICNCDEQFIAHWFDFVSLQVAF
jgi:hypothetical protein